MTEHRHHIVTSVTAQPHSKKAERLREDAQAKAEMATKKQSKRLAWPETFEVRPMPEFWLSGPEAWVQSEKERAVIFGRKNTHGKRRKRPLEREEQATLVRWLKSHGIHYNANLEGLNRHFRARVAARSAGMQRGRPDIEILTPVPKPPVGVWMGMPVVGPQPRGVAIEIKRQKPDHSPVSKEQHDRLERYRADGWLVRVCYGVDEAIGFLVSLGYGR